MYVHEHVLHFAPIEMGLLWVGSNPRPQAQQRNTTDTDQLWRVRLDQDEAETWQDCTMLQMTHLQESFPPTVQCCNIGAENTAL